MQPFGKKEKVDPALEDQQELYFHKRFLPLSLQSGQADKYSHWLHQIRVVQDFTLRGKMAHHSVSKGD